MTSLFRACVVAFAILGAGAVALRSEPVAMAADDEEGIWVTIRVLDADGNPIPTAVVRHTAEEERHRVNAETGEWPVNVFYLPDGSELKITKGMELTLEISAPGYQNLKVQYVVRKRKNLVPVTLQKMDLQIDTEENTDDVPIQFGRDKPIE
jgi:hypothetical protein